MGRRRHLQPFALWGTRQGGFTLDSWPWSIFELALVVIICVIVHIEDACGKDSVAFSMGNAEHDVAMGKDRVAFSSRNAEHDVSMGKDRVDIPRQVIVGSWEVGSLNSIVLMCLLTLVHRHA